KEESGLTCSVIVIDHDSGIEFNIENVSVIFGRHLPPGSDLPGSLQNSMACSSCSVADSRHDSASSSGSDNSVNSDSNDRLMHQRPKAQDAAIHLRSSSLEFDTTKVLVGNRADKEINRFVDPNLVGRGSIVCMGHMKIDVCKMVAPHKAFSARRMSKEFYDEIDAIKRNDFQL
uniref:Uncharacterized protein n=1 Tax=Romanomermis culicivorax TaxID=13658 RepID=A0A915IY44_ROMCU